MVRAGSDLTLGLVAVLLWSYYMVDRGSYMMVAMWDAVSALFSRRAAENFRAFHLALAMEGFTGFLGDRSQT